MSLEAFAYPFLFIALFFESFLLVTFLSKPARNHRARPAARALPPVAVIVPCWNEESTIAGTIESLLALSYPKKKLSIIAVNDGSTDRTAATLARFEKHPRVTVLHKGNGGKHSAMNLGIAFAKDAELIGFLDADSFVAPDALREIVAAFDAPEVAAVTASMSIHQPRTIFQRMQYAEYSFGIMLRHIFGSINGLYVTPGPFSFYRRSVFDTLGLFKHAHLAEDMEMAMRIQRAGMQIGNALRARVYTKGPATLPGLLRQRIRWTTGFLRNLLFDYRDLLGSRKNGVLGMLVLPLGVVAIGSGIVLFFVSIVRATEHALHAFSVVQAAPLSYMFSIGSGWFSFPVTGVTIIASILTVGIVSWMLLGKYLSRIPGRLAPNMIVYLLLYGFIAPLWLIRSVSDVALGVRTLWR